MKHEDPWLPRKLLALYAPALAWGLRRQRVVAMAAVAMLLAAGVVYTQVGKTFMPTMDEGDLIVGIEKLPSISLEQSAALDLKIHQAIMQAIPEVTGVIARAGSDEIGLDPMGLNQTDTYLLLKPQGEWRLKNKQALMNAVRAVLDPMPGIKYSFTQPIEMRVSEMIIGVRGDLVVKIFGPDLDKLNEYASQVEALLKTVRGNQDVYTVQNDGVQYLRVAVDRLQAGRLGLSVEEIQDALRTQIEGNRRTPIVLRGTEAIRTSPAEFGAIRITTQEGSTVPLTSVAKLERAEGPVKIDREMGSRYSVVIANVGGRDLVGFVEEAKALVTQKLPLPTGYRVTWGGQFENQQRAAARLTVVVPVALGLIFVLLFSTFGSVRQALLIGLLTLSGAVHAAQPVNPPGLLPSEIARPLLEQDPGVAAARAGLEVARQEAAILDKSPYEWTARATGQQRRLDSGPRYNEWNIGIERTIRLRGKAAADRSIGTATVEESQARNGEALLQAARELMALWVDWLAAERARERAANNLQSIQISLTAVEKRARAGDASKLDVSIARAELAEHRRLDNDAKTQAAATWSRLSTRFPGLKRQIQTLPTPSPLGESAAFFRDRILAESDELKVAQAQLRMAQSRAERARAEKIPDPTLGVWRLVVVSAFLES